MTTSPAGGLATVIATTTVAGRLGDEDLGDRLAHRDGTCERRSADLAHRLRTLLPLRGIGWPQEPMVTKTRSPSMGKIWHREVMLDRVGLVSAVGMTNICAHHHSAGGSAGFWYQRETQVTPASRAARASATR